MKSKVERFWIYTVQKFHFVFGYLLRLFFCYDKVDLMDTVRCRRGRIPEDLLKSLPRSLRVNNRYLPGEKIEFYIKGEELRITVLYQFHRILKNMDCQGTSGIEVTIKDNYGFKVNKCIFPKTSTQMYMVDTFKINGGGGYVCIGLPPFALVESILVNKKVFIKKVKEEKESIVVYGSSITHGCASSRPALAYTNILEKMTGGNVLNFGFSESAKGEEEVIRYISSLGAKIMIVEFDHNATIEELRKSHFIVYQTIRSITDCWIIFMSRFTGGLSITEEEEQERIRIITNTYQMAKRLYDYKIALILGNTVFGTNKRDYFVDGVHPNDLGMEVIAEAIYDVIKKRGMLN